MLLSLTSWLDWMPNSICDTNRPGGSGRPAHSSEENFVNCAFSRDRASLSGILLQTAEVSPKFSGLPPEAQLQL